MSRPQPLVHASAAIRADCGHPCTHMYLDVIKAADNRGQPFHSLALGNPIRARALLCKRRCPCQFDETTTFEEEPGGPNLAMLRAIEEALQWLPAPQGLSTNPDPPQPSRMRPAADRHSEFLKRDHRGNAASSQSVVSA